jgi:hypothetical protein
MVYRSTAANAWCSDVGSLPAMSAISHAMKITMVVKPEVRRIDKIAAGIARMIRNSTVRRLSLPEPTASRTG